METNEIKTTKKPKPVLTNPDQYPDDIVLQNHLGATKQVWDQFLKMIAEQYPALEVSWRYYKDGSSWLCKITKKTKTICWVSVWPELYKTTFYFGGKAEPVLVASDLDATYIDQYLHGERFGQIRAITVETTQLSDLEAIQKLINIKEKVK